MMNRDAAGLGSWLPRGTRRTASVSLDEQEALLDLRSFALWQLQAQDRQQTDAGRAALLALLQEIWRDELSGRERAVLRGLCLEGKNESVLAREMGLHHSAVGRLRRRAEDKLKGGLGYAMRYQALVERAKKE